MRRTRTRTGKNRSSSNGDSRGTAASTGATVRVPHDSVNEMVLIAAVIVDKPTREKYLEHLPSEMFYGNGHALIWSTLQEMRRKGLEYDPATLKQMGGNDLDVQYVEGLISQRPAVPPNLKHHVEMLYWDSARVATARGPLTRMLELIKDPKQDPTAVISAAKDCVSSLSVVRSKTLRNTKQLIDEQMRDVQTRKDGRATFGFGIDGLDYDIDDKPRLVPGTAPGMITVVTGVSGSGKTTATARGALGMIQDGRRITYGAWEQGSGLTLELLATMRLGYSRTDMMTGDFDEDNMRSLREEMEELGAHVLFDEIPYERKREKFYNERALDRIAQSIIDSRCDVYIADLFRRTLKETAPDDEEAALYSLQHMAKALGVHIIVVQQQKLKEVEQTRDKLPTRDLIKGTSAYVEVADEILAFHRPALWKNVPDDRIFSLVLKQRHGRWPIMIEHEWEPQFGSIDGGTEVEMKYGEDDGGGFFDLGG